MLRACGIWLYKVCRRPTTAALSRRAKALQVTLPVLRNTVEAVHLLVDSTGLKLFGEGEWKVRKHGYARRRRWRKVHLGMGDGAGVRRVDDALRCG